MVVNRKLHRGNRIPHYRCLVCGRFGRKMLVSQQSHEYYPASPQHDHSAAQQSCRVRKVNTSIRDPGNMDLSHTYPRGLQNFKLTCAINAVVQVLAQTPGFYDAVFDFCIKSKKTDLAHILLDIILNVTHAPGPISAEALQAEISEREDDFHFWRQHDCHSFLLCLLETLREDLGKESMGLFTGQIKNQFECRSCSHMECSEPQDFTSLCIPLTENSVEKGLKVLFQKETLTDSKMVCRSCAKDKRIQRRYLCNKELLIARAPDVLVLQLARFKEVRTTNGHVVIQKQQSLFPYNDNMHLNPCGKSPVKYKLFAIISHLGTIEGGHYVSYIRTLQGQHDITRPTNKDKDKLGHESHHSSTWYHCTDDIVTRLKPDAGYPICSHAYLLFYHKLN
ncbi:ubiquitin carboxyl-terminal hydrolase 27-like isoform X2 [Mizuhopecten yessoensis]|nr:ubiquitin carboxyl-terminal hydrolase 27-like isoform X2 [Mizuhopecten yessoensis]